MCPTLFLEVIWGYAASKTGAPAINAKAVRAVIRDEQYNDARSSHKFRHLDNQPLIVITSDTNLGTMFESRLSFNLQYVGILC